jgi:hypothetical protein
VRLVVLGQSQQGNEFHYTLDVIYNASYDL